MENIQNLKVGLGIKVLAIIILISNAFGLLGLLIVLFMKDQIKEMGIPQISTLSLIIGLVSVIVVTFAIILILKKKEIGIYIYFIAEVASITYSTVANGLQPTILISLIIPILMGIFIWKNKEVFNVKEEF